VSVVSISETGPVTTRTVEVGKTVVWVDVDAVRVMVDVWVVEDTGRVVVQAAAETVMVFWPVEPVEVLVEVTSLSPMKVEQKAEALRATKINPASATLPRFSSTSP
jgi:hypothetical protein